MTACENVTVSPTASGSLDLRGGVRLADCDLDPSAATLLDAAFRRLDQCIVVHRDPSSHATPVSLRVRPSLADQHYEMTVSTDGVTMVASDERGHRYALHALARQVLDGGGLVPYGASEDGPCTPVRGVCLDVGRRYWQPERLHSLLDEMAWLGLNRLQLHLTEWNAFRIGLADQRFAHLRAEEHYTADQLNELIEAAHADGIQVSVELNLPAHCTALIGAVPALDVPDTDAVLRDGTEWVGHATPAWMIDVTRPAVVDFCADLVTALVREVHADAFHLGGDEWFSEAELARSPSLVAAAARLTDLRARTVGDPTPCTPADVVVDFLNTMCAVVRRAGARAELWSWWQAAGARTLRPDPDITITAWGTLEEVRDLAGAGHPVVASPESTHYVTPRTSPGNLDGVNYVAVDCARLLSSGPAPLDGEQLAIWCDWAEQESDDYFRWYTLRPLQVFAARTWAGATAQADRLRRIAITADEHGRFARPHARRRGHRVELVEGERILGVRLDASGGVPLTSEGGQWTKSSAEILDAWRDASVELADPAGAWEIARTLPWQLPQTWMTLPLAADQAVAGRVRLASGASAADDRVEWLIVAASEGHDHG